MDKEPFRGIFTIPATPFDRNGEIDESSFRRCIDFCIACGAHGLVYPVNASSFSVLSDDERQAMTEILVAQTGGKIPVVVGVQHLSGQTAARMASHAKQIGANGVIAMPPYAWKQQPSTEAIYDYYRMISEAAQMPIFVQNNPPPIGIVMSPEFLNRLCNEIENVSYIKEEVPPSTLNTSRIIKLNSGSCKGVMGGAGGRYLIEEYRRGTCGNMPGCHVTDVMVAFWKALDSNMEGNAMQIYRDLAPLYFFETQLPGVYNEILHRRGVIECPAHRNGIVPIDKISSSYLDEILKSLEPWMSWTPEDHI